MSGTATVACPFCDTLNRADLSKVANRPKCGSCAKPLLLDRPVRVTSRDFDAVLAGTDVPVLVDFYADWCGPCKVMAPVLDEIARVRAGGVLVAKLDTDRNQDLARRFQITGIPTVIVFQDAKEVAREIGAVPRPRLERLLDLMNQPPA